MLSSSGATFLLPPTPSWGAQNKFNFSFIFVNYYHLCAGGDGGSGGGGGGGRGCRGGEGGGGGVDGSGGGGGGGGGGDGSGDGGGDCCNISISLQFL